MTTAALLILLVVIIIAMATQQHRRKLPAETMILLTLLDRLQAAPEDADSIESQSA